MEHIIHALAGAFYGLQVDKIGLAKVNAAQNLGKVFRPARGKIINAAHLRALLYQPVGEGRRDKPRNARNQVSCHFIFMISNQGRLCADAKKTKVTSGAGLAFANQFPKILARQHAASLKEFHHCIDGRLRISNDGCGWS